MDVVEETLSEKLDIPAQIQKVMNKDKKSINIGTYTDLKEFLLKN
jgi:threonine synthase